MQYLLKNWCLFRDKKIIKIMNEWIESLEYYEKIFFMKFLNNTNEYWLWKKKSNFGINEFLFSLILKKKLLNYEKYCLSLIVITNFYLRWMCATLILMLLLLSLKKILLFFAQINIEFEVKANKKFNFVIFCINFFLILRVIL